MQIGAKYPIGDVKADCWEKIYETTLSSSATTLTISNLTGDTDDEYILIFRVKNNHSGVCNYNLTFNNDTGSNYGFQYVRGIGTTEEALRGTGITSIAIATVSTQNYISFSKSLIYAKSGYERTVILHRMNSINGKTVTIRDFYGGVWSNTANEITSIEITASQSNGIGADTYISLYKKVDKV
jgi:hypothetical protein